MTTLAIAMTYDDASMREDLLGILKNLTPTETQLVSGLGTSVASAIRHETLMDTLGDVKTNAQIEGAAATYHQLTSPTRLYNYCQIFKQGFKVSGTEEEVNKAAFDSRYQYEATKALKMLKNDMEYALMRGSLASGSGSDVARQLRGVKLSSSLVTSQSGISVSEKIFNDLLQLGWDNGCEMNALYGSMYMKRKVSGFTAGATKNVETTDKRLVNTVDIYEADAAKLVKLFAHRYVTVSGDTNYDVVLMNEDYWKSAYLRKPKVEQMAKTGDSTDGQCITEMTLENLHPNAAIWSKMML